MADFDQPSPNENVELSIRGLNLTVLDENRVQITFNAQTKPAYLYFRVDQLGLLTDSKAELVVLNQGLAGIGANTLVLDQRDDNYGGVIAKAILALQQNTYRLSMSLGTSDDAWGPVSEVDNRKR